MSGLQGLDRAQMERERLARLARQAATTGSQKRQRSITPPALSRPAKVAKMDDSDTNTNTHERPATAEQPNGTTTPRNAPATSLSTQPALASSQQPETLQYPSGAVKKTWAFGHPRTGSDIKLEEVLEKHTLRTALLSSFQWDTDWIMSKVDTSHTKLVFVMQAKGAALREQMMQETAHLRKVLRLCFPCMDGQINCMHSKLMLLFHTHKLRIAVPTANLTPYDWGETGVMENSVFLIDLPRLPEGETQTAEDDSTEFMRQLTHFLRKQDISQDVISGLSNFDDSALARYHFIHTVGGMNYGDDMKCTGVHALAAAARALGSPAPPSGAIEVDFAASSLGALTYAFLQTIHDAARGISPSLTPPPPPRLKAQTATTASVCPQTLRAGFRIYFPTLATVQASTGGTQSGGTICFQRKWWEGSDDAFPRACFRDYRSTRSGLLSHNKILCVRGVGGGGRSSGGSGSGSGSSSTPGATRTTSTTSTTSTASEASTTSGTSTSTRTGDYGAGDTASSARASDGRQPFAWSYIGSANLSESAWGKMVYDRRRKEWKLNCRNWECGVVMGVPCRGGGATAGSRSGSLTLERGDDTCEGRGKGKGKGKGRTLGGEPRSGAGGQERQVQVPDMDVFSGVLDLPFEYPGRAYGDKEPWFFTEPH